MVEWQLTENDLKKYPHFDPLITLKRAQEYPTNRKLVARHAFYPFILYFKRYTRFAKKGSQGKSKERPIRYAAHLDSCIFSYYRHILSRQYESELGRLGLLDSVLAYRRILLPNRKSGKCNIHFALDAILKIRELRNCCVIALDITKYFESLDHARLKQLWCRMLGARELPDDHFQVFKAITKYADVEKLAAYERLGHFGTKLSKRTGQPTTGYLTSYDRIPRHLCKGPEFREKIARQKAGKTIIKRNHKPYGIPQGAPISDVLANLYLIDFDRAMAEQIRTIGGAYYRYSDDILIVAPGNAALGKELMTKACDLIRNFGSKLLIKKEKSSLFFFSGQGEVQNCQLVQGSKGEHGLEYLGFRFDGKKVYFRDSTISNLRRKVARAARGEAHRCARRYPDKSITQLKLLFDYDGLVKRFGRAEDFGEHHDDPRTWTFWTYATRASTVFGRLGGPILRQLRNHRRSIIARANTELERAVALRDARVSGRAPI